MTKRFSGIQDVLADLQKKAAIQLQAAKSADSGRESQNYNCPNCRDKGFVIKNIPDLDENGNQKTWPNGLPKFIETLIDCECYRKRQSAHLMKFSEITEEFQKMTFSNFILEGKHELIHEAYQCAIDYYKDYDSIKDNRCNSICLLGQPGSGKTHLLTALSNNLIHKKQVSVLYFPFVEGFNDLKNDFDRLEEKLTKMKRVDVLFIDDLFKTGATKFEIQQMYAVINHRYLNHKPIMVSSELNVDMLCDIDEALGTRIYQMSKDYTVVLEGDRKLLNYRLA
ncbi:ATP-binding protein [Fictibacillus sp. Mic-4]|uniref:ATP-binding protein n=1 Tax=Fictibacillus sp. Mic-4 TaxID=3132826 RepID=UPI003CFB6AD6